MLTYADVCGRMLTYADVCGRMRTYAGVCGRMRTYADVPVVVALLEIDEEEEVLPHVVLVSNMVFKPVPCLTQLVEHKPLDPADETPP